MRPYDRVLLTGIFLISMLGNASHTAAGTVKLYWSSQESNVIHRSNPDGTDSERVVESPGGVIPNIAFDPVDQRMYWPSPVAGGIQSANYDGTNVSMSISGITEPTRVAIDSVNRKAYWTDYGSPSSIWRSNLDGSSREQIVDNLVFPRDIQVDSVNGFYYWVDFFGDIHRRSFDGTQTGESHFANSPRQLAIDPVNGYVYATDLSPQAIIRMKLDFSQPTLWVTSGVSNPEGIVVDLTNGRVIWSNQATSITAPNDTNISSINFAGSDQRVDFQPLWNDLTPGMVRHLAIANFTTSVATPEPNSFALATIGGIIMSLISQHRRKRSRPNGNGQVTSSKFLYQLL